MTSFARFQQNALRNKKIPNLANVSMKDILLRRQKIYLRGKKRPKTPIQMSLFMWRNFIFVKISQSTNAV